MNGRGPAAARANAAEPNVQVIVACHHVPGARCASALHYNELVRIGRLSCAGAHCAKSLIMALFRPTARRAPRGFYLAIARSVGLRHTAS